ncbi:YybH family protein [Flavihumibacter fluvii]|uniref:YybH family protein n=1 Tax=Flavihumibacter fluvii TaxID=2838157 RepID=UPI001BDEA969|nr:nuclear transport factor 2 family protein [Flavihumibacter fluvii]ULQ52247.1 nuclear transport factor 2 family protein [Flavihumibacter fluvii]
MRMLLLLVSLAITSQVFSQQNDEKDLRKLLQDQQEAWNRGDISSFMKGYWNSDSLMFIGGKGVTYGFRNTWERYKKTYDSREKMGTLAFDLLHFIPLAADAYMVVGKWHLTRTVGDIGGYYTLIFRKIDGKWLIISDHTSQG